MVHVAEFRTVAAARRQSGVVLYEAGFDGLFRSDDGGRRWHESQALVDFVVGLDVSPDYAHDRTVAAAGYVKGAYLSTDAGDQWSTIDHGLQQDLGAGNKFAPIQVGPGPAQPLLRQYVLGIAPGYGRRHGLARTGDACGSRVRKPSSVNSNVRTRPAIQGRRPGE